MHGCSRPAAPATASIPPNAACPAQLKQRIQHFVSRGAMDIAGLGEKLVDRFIDLGMVHDVAGVAGSMKLWLDERLRRPE